MLDPRLRGDDKTLFNGLLDHVDVLHGVLLRLAEGSKMKRHLLCFLVIAILVVVSCWGWFNYLGALMVGRGDVREACYLASAFTDFCRDNHRTPNREEAADLGVRLTFIGMRDGGYVYQCGLYGRDELFIERDGNGRFQFLVSGNSFR